MGTMFSTRWNGIQTRPDTDRRPVLDVKQLRHMDALTPGTTTELTWTDTRGMLIGRATTHMHAGGDALTVAYDTAREPVRERFPVQATPCNYGGVRLWLTCHGCDRPRHVLYCVDGLFRCRACHDLAYTSTRETETDRARRRLAKLYDRLGAAPDTPGGIPPRPSHMYRKTYERIVKQLRREYASQAAMLDALDTPG